MAEQIENNAGAGQAEIKNSSVHEKIESLQSVQMEMKEKLDSQ